MVITFSTDSGLGGLSFCTRLVTTFTNKHKIHLPCISVFSTLNWAYFYKECLLIFKTIECKVAEGAICNKCLGMKYREGNRWEEEFIYQNRDLNK